jgi:hypothetical protein
VRNGIVGLHTHAPVRTEAAAQVGILAVPVPAPTVADAAKLLDERISMIVEQLLPQSADAKQVRSVPGFMAVSL